MTLRETDRPPDTRTSGQHVQARRAADEEARQAAGLMRLSVLPRGDTDIVVLVGELDIATAPELTSAIDRLLIQGRNRIVVDLDAVTFFDARAIDALIAATCATALAGGTLRVTENRRFMQLLRLSCEAHRVNVADALQGDGSEPRSGRSATIHPPGQRDGANSAG